MTKAVIFGLSGPEITPQEIDFFTKSDPWGFILFSRNYTSKDQLRQLTASLRDAVGRDAPILVDQEGGRVERFAGPGWHSFRPALDQGQTARDPILAMYQRGRLIAHDLRSVGIDVNCAPLGDIAADATHAVLQNRCYGTTLGQVTKRARAMVDGLIGGGVLPVLKHIPGQGRATLDSHKDLPRVATDVATLRDQDFAAFQALRDIPLGMTAHIVFDDIDPKHPATQSPRMIQEIRQQIGFDGLLMTDDLGMQALTGTMAERAIAAFDAGCDLVLHCDGDMDAMEQVADVAPAMTPVQRTKGEAALMLRQAGTDVDILALKAEFDAQFGG